MDHIAVTSTLTRLITPLHFSLDTEITMYVCGITPYDDAHIGHGRCYVTFDFLYRLLLAHGYKVRYCRNVTDIDDKLLNKAMSESGIIEAYRSIAERYTNRFHEDVKKLGCLNPTYEPRVTDHIPEIIIAVQRLIDSGHAYVSNGSVYFRIHSYPKYGELSCQNSNDMCAGARVEINDEKENSFDFVIWKSEKTNTFWQSPWGFGRPGWHIECTALALKYLGETIDIHGGGMDLMFPHHENERAQSESLTGKQFVRIWIHNAFVRIQREKMSKSLGNFIPLRLAFEKVEPMVLRYYYLIHNYRNPLDFSWDDIMAARKSYQRLIQIVDNGIVSYSIKPNLLLASLDNLSSEVADGINRILYFLRIDLNVQGACGVIFDQAAIIKQHKSYAQYVVTILQGILGLTLEPLSSSTVIITPEIEKLLYERKQARAEGNWKRSDELRAQLEDLQVVLHDEKVTK